MRLLASLFLASTLLFGANELSGRRAPGFSLPDSRTHRYDLNDYRGKWVVLDFMRTDCPHCQILTNLLEQAKARYGAKLVVLDIVNAPPDNISTVASYIKAYKVTSPMLFDQGQMTASYFNLTPAKPQFDSPHLFVVDPNGMIVRDWGYENNPRDLTTTLLFRDLDQVLNAERSGGRQGARRGR